MHTALRFSVMLASYDHLWMLEAAYIVESPLYLIIDVSPLLQVLLTALRFYA